MHSFKPMDEATHPAGNSNTYWNESFYMNFFDDDKELGGATRIGFHPNQGVGDGFVLLFLPDGGIGFIRTFDRLPNHLTCNAVGNVRHECLEPLKKWRISFDGPMFYFENPADAGDFSQIMLIDLPRRQLHLELEFEGIHDLFDFHESMLRRLAPGKRLLGKLRPGYVLNHMGPALHKLRLLPLMGRAQHYEQAGRICGTIRIDEDVFDFSGHGQRDHSWGVRDMRVPTHWRWFSCQFGEDLCFNATRVETLAFRVYGGYVYNEGRSEMLRSWSYDVDWDTTRRWARRLRLDLETESGRRFEIQGEAMINVPINAPTEETVVVVNEACMRYRWQDRTTLGISEFMGHLR